MSEIPTRKQYEAAEIRIVDLFRTTPLNRREIAEIMHMSGSEVGTIIARNHVVKNYGNSDGKFKHPDGYTPCMLTLDAWPRCYGQGCYWVGDDGESECLAYNAMKISAVLGL